MIDVSTVSKILDGVKEAVITPSDDTRAMKLPKLPKLPKMDGSAVGKRLAQLGNRYSDARLGLDAAVRSGKRKAHTAAIGAKVEIGGLVDRLRKDKKVRRRVKEDQDHRKKTGD